MSGKGGSDKPSMAAALRLLQRLSEAGGALVHSARGLRFAGQAGAEEGKSVPAELARFCLEQDWLRLDGGRLVVSDAGHARLKRHAASGDVFLQQHQLRAVRQVEIAGSRRPVLVDDGESPLGRLKSRKDRQGRPLLSAAQFEAGERLRADYDFAQLSPRVTANWSALAPSGGNRRGAPSDAAGLRDDVLAAKERVIRALKAVGPELAGVLLDICCELQGLEQAEKSEGWPARAGKVILQIALSRLARHYGYLHDEDSEHVWRRLRHWGADDYRPTIDAWRSPPG